MLGDTLTSLSQPLRGGPTEGRYLVFESGKSALTLDSKDKTLSVGAAVPNHDTDSHRFILHATSPPPATTFNIQFYNPVDKKTSFVTSKLKATSSIHTAAVFNITDQGNGKGYTIQDTSSRNFISISKNGKSLSLQRQATSFTIYSVTKSTDSGTGF